MIKRWNRFSRQVMNAIFHYTSNDLQNIYDHIGERYSQLLTFKKEVEVRIIEHKDYYYEAMWGGLIYL